jgi:hypothetical protein
MSLGIALGIIDTVVGIAGSTATVASYLESTNAEKSIIVSIPRIILFMECTADKLNFILVKGWTY